MCWDVFNSVVRLDVAAHVPRSLMSLLLLLHINPLNNADARARGSAGLASYHRPSSLLGLSRETHFTGCTRSRPSAAGTRTRALQDLIGLTEYKTDLVCEPYAL